MVLLPNDAPCPRLCTLQKDSLEQEYGYNLHAEKGRGQFVGTVDRGSIADRAGLKTGDRIFAVSGHSIQGEGHKKVVERIKQDRLKCELLVIDEEGAQWYKEHSIEITPQLPNVIRVCQDESDRCGSVLNSSSPPPNTWYAPSQNNNTSKVAPVFVAPPPPEDEMRPRPRLCKLHKTSPTDEFGFNLHAEKGRGHFIGTVDQGGIGDLAGLRMGQRIVGVNGELVYPTTAHKDVVSLIKRSPLVTELLVASEDVDKWYKEHQEEYSFNYIENESRETTTSEEYVAHTFQINADEEYENHYHIPQEIEEEVIARRMTLEVLDSSYTDVKLNKEVEAVTEPIIGHGLSSVNHPIPVAVPSSNDNDLLNAVFSVLPVAESVEVNPATQNVHFEYDLAKQLDSQNEAVEITHKDQQLTIDPPNREPHDIMAQIFTDSLNHEINDTGKLISDDQREYQSHPVDYSQYLSTPAVINTVTQQSAEQISPVSQNSSGYGYSDSSMAHDGEFSIYNLSAKEARERLRNNKRDQRYGMDMSIEDKYKLVSNM